MLVLETERDTCGRAKTTKTQFLRASFLPSSDKKYGYKWNQGLSIYPTNSIVSETKTATTTTAARRTEMVTIKGRAHLKGKKEKVRL